MRLLTICVIWTAFFELAYCSKITNTTFVATNEWQVIPQGAAIPAGLHVRINLTTGKREAKLLNEEEKSNSDGAIVAKADYDSSLLNENLKKKKKLNGKKFDHFKLDAEVISSLIEEFLNLTHLENIKKITVTECMQRKLYILDNFEQMLHQIDNSIYFTFSNGGLELLLPIVANESLPLRLKAVRVLGVITQNNPEVQKEVFKKNFGTYLLKQMISSTNSEELSTSVFAFGSLIRKFPQAQQFFLPSSGMQALIGILKTKCELKVKIKVINLLSDLVEEHKEMIALVDQPANEESIQYYKNSQLSTWLLANGYCESVASVGIQVALECLKQPDLSEDYIVALKVCHDICHMIWVYDSQMKFTLTTLKNQLMSDSNDYNREVAEEILKVSKLLNISLHEEL